MLIDPQQKLDELLEEYEELQEYVSKLYYIPPGTQVPSDVTHTLVLASQENPGQTIKVGADTTPKGKILLDTLLGVLNLPA